MSHQTTIQRIPRRPVTMKAPRQPIATISQVTNGNEKADPAVEPLLKILQAKPRSTRGNQLKATFVKEGTLAASPIPSISRAAMNWETPRASPVTMVNSDHQPTARVREILAPIRSTNQP